MVKLEIKTLSNEVFYVECEENESIRDVKHKVAERTDLSETYNVDLLKFLYAGKVLEDHDMIKSYEIKPDGYLVLVKQTPGKPQRVKRKPIPPFSLNSDSFFSATGLGGFNNPLLSSHHSEDPFMQPTFKSHVASHNNAFGTQGQTYKQNPDGTYSTIGGDFRAYGSFTPASESLEGDAEPKISTDLTLFDPSSAADETLKSGSIVAADVGSSNASSWGGMQHHFKGGAGFGAMGGLNAGGGFGARGMPGFNAGGATSDFGVSATGRSTQNANLPGGFEFSQFGAGKSPFGKSSGAMVDKDVETLMEMGFKRAVAKKALKLSCNHLQVAINMLIGGEVSDADDEDEPKVQVPIKLPELEKKEETKAETKEEAKPEAKPDDLPLNAAIAERRSKFRSLIRPPSPTPPSSPSPPPPPSPPLDPNEPLSGLSLGDKTDSSADATKTDGDDNSSKPKNTGPSAFGPVAGFEQSFRGYGGSSRAGGFGGMGGFGNDYSFGGMGSFGGAGGFSNANGFSGMASFGGAGNFGRGGGISGTGALGGTSSLGAVGNFGETNALGGTGSLGGTDDLSTPGLFGHDNPSLSAGGFPTPHGFGGGFGGGMGGGFGGGMGSSNVRGKELAQMLRQNPAQLQMMKQRLAHQPELVNMIDNNPQQFLQLLEQMDDSGGFGGSQGIEVNLTYADQQVVNEIESMGFVKDRVVEAYVLCDRNKEFTVNYLLRNT